MNYTIYKNWHYALPYFIAPHYRVKSSKYLINFDSNCWYEKSEVEHTGINKLVGYGFGLNQHKNSIRVGWQPNFEKHGWIKLYAYWYDQSTKGYQSEYIRDVHVNQEFSTKITIYKYSYCVGIHTKGSVYESTTIAKSHNIRWGLLLRPYFGGKSKAPRKMKIMILKK